MTVFITDSRNSYEASAAERKVLLEMAVIKASNFLPAEVTEQFNSKHNSSEVTAGELYITALEKLLGQLNLEQISPIPFQEHKPAYEQVYSLLFHRLWEYGNHRFQLEIWLENFRKHFSEENLETEFDLGNMYSWFEAAQKNGGSNGITIRQLAGSFTEKLAGKAKNLLQSPLRRLQSRKKINPGTTKVMIVSYNIAHHLEIFQQYVRHTLENTGQEVHVVIMSNASNAPGNLAEAVFGKNDRLFVHDFADFRTTNFSNSRRAIGEITKQLPELSFLENDSYFTGAFRNYSWMQTVFDRLKPSLALIVNLHETGRILSDVARVKGIPTIQVDYGLFSDHQLMNSRISFTARAVLSDAVTEVWERRGDTSLQRVPIGFCKLDNLASEAELLVEKTSFFQQNHLDPEKFTLFFASSPSHPGEAYDAEKQAIVTALSAICERNNYNLIVKKHPLESDDLLVNLLQNRKNQRIFGHTESTLEKLIVFSDVITTQGSSIVLEALFYQKMPVFLGSSETKQLILAGMTGKDDVIYFSDFDRFEAYVHQLLHNTTAGFSNKQLVAEKIGHILYKTDGKAYIRLYELAGKLMKTAQPND